MIKSPNYTQIPNDYLDHIMKTLNGSENLIFLAIMRKTLGWNKIKDKISYSQIVEKTGIGSFSTVKKALVSLEEKGLIVSEKVGKFISYEANIEITTETVDNKKDNDYRNCSDTITETVAINEKITTETVDTKETSLKKLIKERTKKEFIIPSVQEIIDYVNQKKLVISPLKFHDWYTKTDWKDNNGKQIYNWKNKAINWDSREKDKNPKATPFNTLVLLNSNSDKVVKNCPVCGSELDKTLTCQKCHVEYDVSGRAI